MCVCKNVFVLMQEMPQHRHVNC